MNNQIIWVKIDFVKWFKLPGNPNKIFEISNLGFVRSYTSLDKVSIIPGTIRPGSSDRPEYKYFSVRIFGKSFKIPMASCVLYAFQVIDDLNKYNISFADNDHKNCSLDNLHLDLKKSKHLISSDTLNLYNSFAENRRLYKIISFILKQKSISPTVFYSVEDILQDYCMYVYDNLYQFETRKFSKFDTFCFFKAYDFLSSLKYKLSRTPECYYTSYLETLNNDKPHEQDYLERHSFTVSDFTMRMARYQSIIIENGL